jgi:nucleolar protein 14
MSKIDRVKERVRKGEKGDSLSFDKVVVKDKDAVLGRRMPGSGANRARSRQKGLEKRQATLKVEFESRGGAGEFIDRRFTSGGDGGGGGNDDGNDDIVTGEERYMIDLLRKRNAISKRGKSKYNLEEEEDDDDDDDGGDGVHRGKGLGDSSLRLTHRGIDLRSGDGALFNDFVSKEDEEEEVPDALGRGKGLSARVVNQLNFGGGEDDERRFKSRRERLHEIIAKSRMEKAMRAKEKEERFEEMDALDEQFNLVKEELFVVKSKPKMTKEQRLAAKQEREEAEKKRDDDNDDDDGEQDDYDRLVMQLDGEIRAQATDRMMTPAERAEKERERLVLLERERQRRMQMDFEPSSDDDNNSDSNSDDGMGQSKSDDYRAQRRIEQVLREQQAASRRRPGDGGDDLVDDFALDSDDDDSDASASDVEFIDDDSDSDSDKESAGAPSALAAADRRKRQRQSSSSSSAPFDELPYTFAVPKKLKGLAELLDNVDGSAQREILSRMLICNHPSLSETNLPLVRRMYDLVAQRLMARADQFEFGELDALVGCLTEVGRALPKHATQSARAQLETLLARDQRSWPNVGAMFWIKSQFNLFPLSDFQHPVLTPLELYLGRCLVFGKLSTSKHAASLLLVASLAFHAVRTTRRFVGEAIDALTRLLSMFAAHRRRGKLSFAGGAPAQASDTIDDGGESGALPWRALAQRASPDDSHRGALLDATLRLLTRFATLYDNVDAFDALFAPLGSALRALDTLATGNESAAKALRRHCGVQLARAKALSARIDERVEAIARTRAPLQWQRHSAAPIKMYRPRFREDAEYTLSRESHDPDRQRAQINRLKRRVRSDEKAAARELRKDNFFLAQQRTLKRSRDDAERTARYNKVMSMLQDQQHGLNEEVKAKKRQKRREKYGR